MTLFGLAAKGDRQSFPAQDGGASALSKMKRNLGGSVGIALLSPMIERRERFHFSILAEAIPMRSRCRR